MKLIVGGAYQGKLDVAKELYRLEDDDCFECGEQIDFSYKLINNFEKYVLYLVENNINPCEFFENNKENFSDKIVVLTDSSCGVVPIDDITRKWREEVGRIGVRLSFYADEVIRVFCGIPTKLK